MQSITCQIGGIMQQVRVNLTFEREMWTKFGELVPNRKKSRIVNDLLKNEVAKESGKMKKMRCVWHLRKLRLTKSARAPSVPGNPWIRRDGIR